MKHKRQLEKQFYKEWCPELELKERIVFRSVPHNLNRIDLHGYTIHDAYIKTMNFIDTSHNKKIYEIYVITGASGQIKKEFLNWLSGHKLIRYSELISSGEFKLWLFK